MNEKSIAEYSMLNVGTQTEKDLQYAAELESYYTRSRGTNVDKARNFAKFVPRQTLAAFLAKHEIFRRILPVHGAIIECGVHLGGLMTWAQLSAIYEPVNHIRQIIGFDTFEGFPELAREDKGQDLPYTHVGGLATDAEADIWDCARLFDLNRPLGHIGRIQLVVGDAVETIPKFLDANPHLVVAMLYLDFDLYKPTKIAIETFLSRMPKGAVIAFDELNQAYWPGETIAVHEVLGIRNLRIERFPYTPQISFAVLE
jgi:hypothetical protein